MFNVAGMSAGMAIGGEALQGSLPKGMSNPMTEGGKGLASSMPAIGSLMGTLEVAKLSKKVIKATGDID